MGKKRFASLVTRVAELREMMLANQIILTQCNSGEIPKNTIK